MGSRPIFRTQTVQEFSQLKSTNTQMSDVTNTKKSEVNGAGSGGGEVSRVRRTSLPSEASPDTEALDLEEEVGELDSELIKHLRLVEWKAPPDPQPDILESSGSEEETDVFLPDTADASVPEQAASAAAAVESAVRSPAAEIISAAKDRFVFRDKQLSDSRDLGSRASRSPVPPPVPADLQMVCTDFY